MSNDPPQWTPKPTVRWRPGDAGDPLPPGAPASSPYGAPPPYAPPPPSPPSPPQDAPPPHAAGGPATAWPAGALPPPAGGPATAWPAGAPPYQPQATGRYPTRLRLLGIAVVVVVVAAGVSSVLALHPFGIGGGKGPALTTPSSIAGETRNQAFESKFQSDERGILDQLKSDGASSSAAGWYRQGDVLPQHFVIAASGPVRGGSPEELAQGFQSGFGGTLGSRTTIAKGGESYSCYQVTGGAVSLGMCVWIDSDFVGAAVCFQGTDLDTCATFTDAARRAVRA